MSTKTGLAFNRATSPADAKKRERARDHLVSRSDAERHQGDEQRVGPGRNADRMGGADLFREGLLERLVGGTHHEASRREDLLHAPRDLALQLLVVTSQVEQRNRFGGAHRMAGILADSEVLPQAVEAVGKSEIRNTKSETNPKSECSKRR